MDRSAWRLAAPLGPSIRQGLVAAIPVGVGVFLDVELDFAASGAVATGALFAGFVGFDVPARNRIVWQLVAAPLIGAAAALGALTGDIGWLAVVTMILVGSAAGLTVAVSPRLAIVGMTVTLTLLVAQGLAIDPDQAPTALLLGMAGAGAQMLMSVLMAVGTPPTPRIHPVARARAALSTMAANLTFRSRSFRHALRWGTAIGVGVAAYHVLDLGEHGYWIPLTILFVLKPELGATKERIAMRAAGTVAGLVLATPLAMAIGSFPALEALAIGLAAAFAFALLALEYALFTSAITVFAVLLAHAMGQSAWQAADQRGLGTLIGIVLAAAAFMVWSNRRLDERIAMPPSNAARR